MTKKKDDDLTKPTNKSEPEFKPGNTPYCQFGDVVLNQDVPWNEVVIDIVNKNISMKKISHVTTLSLDTLCEILKQNYQHLDFKAGACLITLHYKYCSSLYKEF